MFEKTVFLVIVCLCILFYDVPKLKQSNRRERIVYGILTLPILYLSVVYVLDLAWPSLDELVHFFFSKPAHKIVEAIKVPI
ncbi:hypothetical protein [Bacillus sp. ISL-77]|uniref:hypothetical protein n=1 Tax=Bacillus sp. ISL-77 TaxID=2819138 RepID=UPI001BE9C957|nr:hypothetical protein [Bacillus sp. ISL-77]MBT2743484.1 hypothetical protein [Bacillus sp. ISL-77]